MSKKTIGLGSAVSAMVAAVQCLKSELVTLDGLWQ